MILVLNCGSSSIKAALFGEGDRAVTRTLVERIGAGPRVRIDGPGERDEFEPELDGHGPLLAWLLPRLAEAAGAPIEVVGHRVVHGGQHFAEPVRMNDAVVAELERLVPMARSHQPHNLAGVRAVMALWPGLPQVACFDTAFHRTIPEVRQRFALPPELTAKGIRRYGFHGISYEWIAGRLPDVTANADGRVVVAHLGNGASLCAMRGRAARRRPWGSRLWTG